eukprot:850014-Pyramimonas_sp.AAC.1
MTTVHADDAVTFTAEDLAKDYKQHSSKSQKEKKVKSGGKAEKTDTEANGKPSPKGTVVVTREEGKNGKLVRTKIRV